jgi:type IV pilus assembly protein PilM
LGVDFGTSSIKAVELGVRNKKVELLNYGSIDLSSLEKNAAHTERSYDDELTLYLRALLTKLQPKSDSAYVAMPAFIGLLSLVELPMMSDEELAEAIQFEAHRFIPSSLDDVALSWQVVGERTAPDGGKKLEVLAVAALKKEVLRYQAYIEAAHLKLDFLELETFSLVRSVIGRTPGLVLLVDIGSRATNLVLAENGIVKVSRNLDAGGKDITRTLMESLDITQERAEVLKKSTKDFLNTKESAVIFPALDTIFGEAERMLESYQDKHPEAKCQEVVLSGGSAALTGLAQYTEKKLGIPVRQGNPWERIRVPEAHRADVEALGTSFSVALGLALSGVEEAPIVKPVSSEGSKLKSLLNKKL